MHRSPRILITGGGSGGHIMPLFTIAKQLQKEHKKIQFLYVGSGLALEKKLAQENGFVYQGITSGKLRRYFAWQNFVDIIRVIKGYFEAKKLIKKFKPDLVFSKGGYVSLPICWAAWFQKVPVVLHESDTVMGLANRMIARLAQRILMTFDLKPTKHKFKYILTGSPLRKEILKGNAKRALVRLKFNPQKPVLLVMGGSQGAEFLNNLVYQALDKLLVEMQIIHICGAGKKKLIKQVGYVNFEYVGADLADYYALADVIISRAGANSLAEITALKKPNIVIPLPSSANNHQQKNAEFFFEKGATILSEQKDLDSQKFIKVVLDLMQNQVKQNELQKNLEKLYDRNTNEKISQIIWEDLEKDQFLKV